MKRYFLVKKHISRKEKFEIISTTDMNQQQPIREEYYRNMLAILETQLKKLREAHEKEFKGLRDTQDAERESYESQLKLKDDVIKKLNDQLMFCKTENSQLRALVTQQRQPQNTGGRSLDRGQDIHMTPQQPAYTAQQQQMQAAAMLQAPNAQAAAGGGAWQGAAAHMGSTHPGNQHTHN